MTILNQQDALKLYNEGSEAWNAWVKENPDADIFLKGAVFSDDADFRGFKFPNGRVSFTDTTVNGHAYFDGVKFNGYAYFNGVTVNGRCLF